MTIPLLPARLGESVTFAGTPRRNRVLTVGSLFSGIGGIDYAFREAGFRIVFQVEIDSFCRQVLTKHFPNAVRHADIYECHDLPHVDVLTAGFPCQPFSLAGKRLGEKDERYLIPEMFRVIEEVKPNVILFENVPGFASITNGATFRDFCRALTAIGYILEWTHLWASDAGATHGRERWFCTAHRTSSGRRQARISYITPAMADSERIRNSGRGKRKDGIKGTSWRKKSKWSRRTAKNARSRAVVASQSGYRKPRLGRDADGLSTGIHRHQFPAPPGAAQHPAEPPRVTTHAQDRAKRLKALGNAVVPQVIYPIALAIRDWFMMGAENAA